MSLRNAWVVGSGGLAGAAIQRAVLRLLGREVVHFSEGSIPWTIANRRDDAIHRQTRHFFDSVRHPWAIFWAAGASTVASTEADAWTEVAAIRTLISAIVSHRPVPPGVVFFTSSAGAVYGEAAVNPITESSPTNPISPYGFAKLQIERELESMAKNIGVNVVVARTSNIYGPGQSLLKQQGFITRAITTTITRRPLDIYVSLDTLRDYLFVDDFAEMAVVYAAMAVKDDVGSSTSIFASEQPVTLRRVVYEVERIMKRRVPFRSPTSALALRQPRALAFRTSQSNRHTHPRTDLAVGIFRTYLDLLAAYQQGNLPTTRAVR